MWRALAPTILRGCISMLSSRYRDRLFVHLLEQTSENVKFRLGFPTMAGLLQHLRANGFQPTAVVDVGAYVGEWTRLVAPIFPQAPVFMIEANPQSEATLRRVQQELGDRATLTVTLLGPEDKTGVPFYQLGAGSSVLEELTSFEKTAIRLPMRTLDGVLGDRLPSEGMLLKLDVQGFELAVLAGASKVLCGTQVVILETALLPYNQNAPLFADVVGFLRDAGFLVYDFCGQFRRQSDQTLFQTDVAFAREDSPLRANRKFWLHEP